MRPQPRQYGAVANAPERARVDHVCRQRRLEYTHEGVVLILRDGAGSDRSLVDRECRGANPGGIHCLPDGTA